MAPKTKKPNAWLTFLSVYRSENVGNKGKNSTFRSLIREILIVAHFFHEGEEMMKEAGAKWKLLTDEEKQSYLTVDTSGKDSVPTKENNEPVSINVNTESAPEKQIQKPAPTKGSKKSAKNETGQAENVVKSRKNK